MVRKKGHRPQSRSFIHKRDAEAWAKGIELEIDRTGTPAAERRRLEEITLADLVVRYRDAVVPRKRGARYEVWLLDAFLRHPIASKRLSELRRDDFATYRDQRLGLAPTPAGAASKPVKAGSLKRQLSPLRNMFEIATKEWGYPLLENPLEGLKLGESQRRERRLKDGELERLSVATRECLNPYILPLILFANETGMRRGEILNIQWSDINGDTLLIPVTKNGHARAIPLTRRARAVLSGLAGNGGERPFPITASALSQAWRRLRRRAGLPDLHFHDLRHEAISRFFELHLTVPEVASISGHRDARILLRYAHARKDAILAKLDG
jgi:integrase